MKRIMLAFAIVAALSASAAMQRVATVQIANMTALIESVGKFGNHLGNPMLTSLCGGALVNNEVVQFFGPMRAGADASALVSINVDPALVSLDTEKMSAGSNECADVTALYPLAHGKAGFLSLHPEAVLTNGVALVESDTLDDPVAVAFSTDGKWAAVAKTPASARAALKAVAEAARPMNGEILRVAVEEPGIAIIRKLVSDAIPKAEPKDVDGLTVALSYLRGISFIACAFAVTDRGLDLKADARLVTGSVLDRFFLTTLKPDALAFASSAAIMASATAPGGAPAAKVGFREQLDALYAILKELGVDARRFLADRVAGDTVTVALDVPALSAYCTGAETNGLAEAFGKFVADAEAGTNRIEEIYAAKLANRTVVPSTQPAFISFEIKGHSARRTLASQFAATFPEFAKKPLVTMSAGSYTELTRAILSHVEPMLPEKMRPVLQLLKAQLPTGENGCTACAAWREGNRVRSLWRMAPDELKCIGALINTGMSFAAMQKTDADDDDEPNADEGKKPAVKAPANTKNKKATKASGI